METDPEFLSDLDMKPLFKKQEDGEGGVELYRAVDRLTGDVFIAKVLFLHQSHHESIMNNIFRLNHPNILKCREACGTYNRIRLLFEHMEVHEPLLDRRFTSEPAVFGVFNQVLLGLEYLHGNAISHGDVNLSNILVDSEGRVKVLYLGKIKNNVEKSKSNGDVGEIHDEFSWDVWCVGLCILKLIEGSKMEPSTQMWSFILCCMQIDIPRRWTVKKLLSHPCLCLQQPHEREISDSLSIKKSNVSLGVEQGINEVDSSKDPIQMEIVYDVLERCRQHSAMLLPDCDFEKDKCIQMWIAEECIEFEEKRIMEDVANLYFDELVHEEFIIPSKFDHLYGYMRYKVNTSKVPASFSGKGKYIRIVEGGLDQVSGKALHLVWHCKRLDKTSVDALKKLDKTSVDALKKLDKTSVDALKKLNHLRTLLVLADFSSLTRRLPNDTFKGFYLLRTLDLSCTNLLELPSSIRLLEELRYLDICETPIKRLPESISCLHILQTLRLRGCSGLSTLPMGLGQLINLRHLALNIVGQLEFMPSGMGNLVKLQTLQAFIVGENDGCGIRELKHMNDITGSFCISKLENVSSADEAKEAALWDKKLIDKLELRWQDNGNEKSQDTQEILECLQPQFHLRELQIVHYSGLKLPRWISNPSYIDLSSISLYKCINCDILPTIGKLPSLKNLHIVEMNNLRNINTLFCRDDGIKGLRVSLKVENAFPKLEKLTLENMLNLEEWTGIKDGDFPCLSHLSIRHCPKLYSLSSLSCLCSLQCLELNHCMQLLSLPKGKLPATLESLIVKGCPEINKRCLTRHGPDYLKIGDVKNVYVDFEKFSLNK